MQLPCGITIDSHFAQPATDNGSIARSVTRDGSYRDVHALFRPWIKSVGSMPAMVP